MKKFDKTFIAKTDSIKETVIQKYNIAPSNNICLLINELIRLDKNQGVYLERYYLKTLYHYQNLEEENIFLIYFYFRGLQQLNSDQQKTYKFL